MCRERTRLILSAAGLLAATSAMAGTLPEQLTDWKMTETKVYSGESLYDYIDGGADVYFEYGFSTVQVGYYTKGGQEILIEAYRMSSLQAAAGVYSFFKNHAASPLPEPYTGKIHQLYLECLNGDEYIKLINYDSLGVDERLILLRNLLPKPTPPQATELFDSLPQKRLPDSEISFNGPIALRNFCPLGRRNLFGVGERTKASGCLVEIEGKQYKWVTLSGDSAQLAQDSERFLAFQSRNDYRIQHKSEYTLLEDQLTGKMMVMIGKGHRIHFAFGIGAETEIIELMKAVE